jgi:hypothetical protein
MLMDRLDRQVVKYKQMLQDHSHTSPKRLPIRATMRLPPRLEPAAADV